MISYFSKIIASFLYQRKIISKNELTVCEYGFELIISTAIGFGLVLISGIVFNELLSVILFYAVFVCFRFFTGGYHATTHLRCKIVLLVCCLNNSNHLLTGWTYKYTINKRIKNKKSENINYYGNSNHAIIALDCFMLS